ncbi:MAG: ScyD/ScyE family protein [Thermomicrobiales bacterium]
MSRFSSIGSLLMLVAISVSGLASPPVFAQEDVSPAATSPSLGPTAVATGLINPRGFTWDDEGRMIVALAGNGGLATDPTRESASGTPDPNATPDLVADSADVLVADQSGAVVKIMSGCPVDVAIGLPSYNFLPLNWADGVIDVAVLDGTLYALVDGGGEAALHPEEPNGVYRIQDGAAHLVADLSAWFRANPVAEPTHDISPDGQPYAMVASEGKLWITESNHEQLLTVTPQGTITRIVDLSPAALVDVGVPTGLAIAPDGSMYIGLLSEVPFPDGAAKVIEVATDGAVRDVWTGLTAVTDIALGPDGTLYASELSTGNSDTDPFYHPHSGAVVHQTGPDTMEVVVSDLDYPVHLGFGPDGMIYVGGPALGSNAGQGAILRLDPTEAPVSAADLPQPHVC